MSETDPIGERIRAASQSVSAPLALREAIERDRAPAAGRKPPSRLSLALLGAMLATIATVAALVAPGPPTVTSVARAALKAPEREAPAGESYLRGYTPVGVRTDTIAGRTARTVIYRRGAAGVHYTIVDGEPLALPGSKRVRAGRLSLATARVGDLSLVAWHARGKTCVLASKTLTTGDLVALLRSA